MPQYDSWVAWGQKSEGLKDHRRGCNPRSCGRQTKAQNGRQTINGTHSVTPSGFCFIHSLCAGVAPLPVLCRPRRGLFALVVIGGLKDHHTASPGHRPREHGNPSKTPRKGRTIMLLPLQGVEDMSSKAQGDALSFWDTLSPGQQTESTRPHPGRDTKNKPASQRTPWEAGWSGLFRIWNSGCYCTIFQITLVLRPVPFNRNSFTDCLHVIVVVPYWFKL